MEGSTAPGVSERLTAMLRNLAGARTGRNALFTVGGGFGVQFALLVSGILVARALGVEDRGHLALFWVIALVLAFVGTTGLNSSVTFWVARKPSLSRPLARTIIRVGLGQTAVAVAVQATALWLSVSGESDSVRSAALISIAVLPSMIAVFYGMAFLQGLELFKAWTAVRLMPAVIYTGGVIGLAAAGGATLVAVTAVWVVSYAITAIVALVAAGRALPPADAGDDRPSLRELQGFGARAFLGSASPTDTLQLDQLLVGLWLSPASLGLYVVGIAFTNLPRIVAQSVGFVIYPYVARRPTLAEARHSMWVSAGLCTLVVALIVLALELTAGELVPLFFGSEFEGAVDLTRILLIGAALVSVRRVLADGARGAGYPGVGAVAEVASTVVLLPAMAFAADLHGAEGVAWAVAIASAAGLTTLLVGLGLSSPRASDRPTPDADEVPEPDLGMTSEAPH